MKSASVQDCRTDLSCASCVTPDLGAGSEAAAGGCGGAGSLLAGAALDAAGAGAAGASAAGGGEAGAGFAGTIALTAVLQAGDNFA